MNQYLLFSLLIVISCNSTSPRLKQVSVEDFSKFIQATQYITDAEKYGWSIVQIDVFDFKIDSTAVWQLPNGIDSTTQDFPITQVSYNDALAYCKWNNTRLPTYEEYWDLVASDLRPVNQANNNILPSDQVNIVGNVWDITTTKNKANEIRLAGGSYLCNALTCNGTNPNRILFVDMETGNSHISFSVVYDK